MIASSMLMGGQVLRIGYSKVFLILCYELLQNQLTLKIYGQVLKHHVFAVPSG